MIIVGTWKVNTFENRNCWHIMVSWKQKKKIWTCAQRETMFSKLKSVLALLQTEWPRICYPETKNESGRRIMIGNGIKSLVLKLKVLKIAQIKTKPLTERDYIYLFNFFRGLGRTACYIHTALLQLL